VSGSRLIIFWRTVVIAALRKTESCNVSRRAHYSSTELVVGRTRWCIVAPESHVAFEDSSLQQRAHRRSRIVAAPEDSLVVVPKDSSLHRRTRGRT